MPARIAIEQREKVYMERAANATLGAGRIRKELVDKYGDTDVPSERAIRTIMRDFDGLLDKERGQYRVVRWPETFEYGGLPWESASALSPFLHDYLSRGRRPLVKLARWFWRVTQTAPDADYKTRRLWAERLALTEIAEPRAGQMLLRRMEREVLGLPRLAGDAIPLRIKDMEALNQLLYAMPESDLDHENGDANGT